MAAQKKAGAFLAAEDSDAKRKLAEARELFKKKKKLEKEKKSLSSRAKAAEAN